MVFKAWFGVGRKVEFVNVLTVASVLTK